MSPEEIRDRHAKVQHPYIHTAGGGKFYPSNIQPEQFSIKAIAHGLAKECRFAGMIKGFYSVAQHCVLMRDYAAAHNLFPLEQLIYVLLHDAAEAYIGDIATPIKATLPDFNRLEKKIMQNLMSHFGLAFPLPHGVKELDARIVVDEASQLFDDKPEWLQDFANAGIEPLGIDIDPWTWQESLRAFVETFLVDYTNFLLGQRSIWVNSDYCCFKWNEFAQLYAQTRKMK